MRVLVAMSGGVDSSVVAHLMARRGHGIVGVQFRLWEDPLAPPIARILPSKCCHAATFGRAKKVSADLGIPLHDLDLTEEFKREVVDPFLTDCRNGLTPNPCVGCNRTVKFGRLIKLADELGCDKIASGHYARVVDMNASEIYDGTEGICRYRLFEAADKTKDQSYYLYGLSQEQLSRTLFPLGEMRKRDVFALAKAFGVPLPDRYIESQDLCFFPEKDPHAFLDRHLKPQSGDIIDTSGKKRGMHRGLVHYTEGQRRGLRVGGLNIPLHVVAKDAATNVLVVGTREEAMRTELTAGTVNWISQAPSENTEHTLDARIHSLGRRQKGVLTHDGRTLRFRFREPQPGVSPGQSIVLYQGEEIVGGGEIMTFPSARSSSVPLHSSTRR